MVLYVLLVFVMVHWFIFLRTLVFFYYICIDRRFLFDNCFVISPIVSGVGGVGACSRSCLSCLYSHAGHLPSCHFRLCVSYCIGLVAIQHSVFTQLAFMVDFVSAFFT